VNAQNKQTIARIVEPLRKLGVPSAAIVDIDIIKGDDLKERLSACGVPQELIQSWGVLKGNLKRQFEQSGKDMKQGGVNHLDGAASEAAHNLLQGMAGYGIFVVPVGELERWLSELNVQATKSDWLPRIFDRLGADAKSRLRQAQRGRSLEFLGEDIRVAPRSE
jgi:hypothetical protein